MTKKEILKMWEKYHEICSLYRGKPLPSLFEYESIPFNSKTDEVIAVREKNREMSQKHAEIEEIIYILENENNICNFILIF